MADESELVEQIREAIRPWTLSTKKPAFTEQQLIIIALTLNASPQEPRQTTEWILDNFVYYGALSRHAFWHFPIYGRTMGSHDEGREALKFRGNFDAAF